MAASIKEKLTAIYLGGRDILPFLCKNLHVVTSIIKSQHWWHVIIAIRNVLFLTLAPDVTFLPYDLFEDSRRNPRRHVICILVSSRLLMVNCFAHQNLLIQTNS